MNIYTNEEIAALVGPIEELADRQAVARAKHLELLAQRAPEDAIETADHLAETLVDELCEEESQLWELHGNHLGMLELAERLEMIARFHLSAFPSVTWGHSEVFELAAAACRASLNREDEPNADDQRVLDLKRSLARNTIPQGMPPLKYRYADGTFRNYGDPECRPARDYPVETIREFYVDPYERPTELQEAA